MHRKLTFFWFLLGLGSKLQVVASLSISEILVLAAAPFVFFKDYHYMKRDGIMPFFVLSLLVIGGCIIASVSNGTHPNYVLRGLAVTCIISCVIIVSHWMLRIDPGGFKWFVLALPISAIISTFYFKSSVEMEMLGSSSEEIMGGPIFWITRLYPLVMAPTLGWYLHTPSFINVLAPLFMAVFSLLSSASGRSVALATFCFAVIVVIGGKTRWSIDRISRHFGMICTIGVLSVVTMYYVYRFSAMQGWLGEEAAKKYEMQTQGGGLGRLILGGRGDAFMGLLGCRDKPIIGWGPWAMDENNYTEEFFNRFGTWEDVENYVHLREWQTRIGHTRRLLSCHSHITEFWAWYGICGLIFWLYVLFVFLRYLKQDVAAVPHWFAWIACSLPSVFWGIFFSPFSERVSIPMLVVASLMARAVRKGAFMLPREMVQEIR